MKDDRLRNPDNSGYMKLFDDEEEASAKTELKALIAEVRRLRAKVALADKLAEAAHDLARWDICRFVEQAPEDERIYFESGVGGVRSAVVRYRKGVS